MPGIDLKVIRNNCSTNEICKLCGCCYEPDIPWCITDESGHLVCRDCANRIDPQLVDVADEDNRKWTESKDKIGEIRKMVDELDSDDPVRLSGQMEALHDAVNMVWCKANAEASQIKKTAALGQIKAMEAVGFVFDAITIDGEHFVKGNDDSEFEEQPIPF